MAAADPWYEHYAKAEKALEDRNWALAVQELNESLGKRGDSGARVRTYGMKVTSYFPYLKLGIAYYHLGQAEAALQAFETEERLGAIGQSEAATAELERYRGLAVGARETAAAVEAARIRQVVERNLLSAQDLEGRGLLEDAVAVLDRALAVAPEDPEALAAMDRIRRRIGEIERQRQVDLRVGQLIEEGRELLRQADYGKASSVLRQALSLRPTAEIQTLLDEAQRRLRAGLEQVEDRRATITAGLAEVRRLEAGGEFETALERLQSVLALDPSSSEAGAIQSRLLAARAAEADATARLQAIRTLLAEGEERFRAGSAEESLAAANRALALDPGNDAALGQVARAYGLISRRILGTGARQNIPPAVRFVDLREERENGALVQRTRTPEFRLSGVVIDDSPVELTFLDGDEQPVAGASFDAQPVGDYFVTEFSLDARLVPGLSTFRLVAEDEAGLSSSSEYRVAYDRPLTKAPGFYALLIAIALGAGGAVVWRRSQRRARLRTRRFNPYVAGAPVLDERMFFGRTELVDRILETIHNNSLLLYGERRIGKTSIQHQLKRRLQELDDPGFEFFPVYIDLQGTPEERFFATLAEDIFQELGPVLGELRPGRETDGEYGYRDFVRDLHRVLKVLRQRSSRKIKLVLLIDEVDELNEYDPRINQRLRSLFMKSFAENLISVVSGVEIKKHWEREGSPWYNFFEELEVKPLELREAQALIERPIRDLFRVDEGVVDRIFALTGGRPYLIQKLCISLVARLHEERRQRITVADVEAVGPPAAD